MAELPGCVKEYVDVELTDNTLTLKGGCQHETAVQEIAVSGPPAASVALSASGSAVRQ
jgi:HSP20 family molecular chaperone IbpA